MNDWLASKQMIIKHSVAIIELLLTHNNNYEYYLDYGCFKKSFYTGLDIIDKYLLLLADRTNYYDKFKSDLEMVNGFVRLRYE